MKPQSTHVARAEWERISRELEVFASQPEVKVTVKRVRKVVVAKKWIFWQRT